jgi:hypothetical protein
MDLSEAITQYNEPSLRREAIPEEVARVLSDNRALVQYQGIDELFYYSSPETVRRISGGEEAEIIQQTNEQKSDEVS